MKIRRPEEKSGGKSITLAEMTRYAAEAAQARSNPAARATLRSFYRSASWLYTESFQVKVATSGQVDAGFDTAQRCLSSAVEAAEAGFTEEAAALSITGARLAHFAYSVSHFLRNSRYTEREMKGILLVAFLGLATLHTLPNDDGAYWQDRLAEVVAALFIHVGAFAYQGADREKAAIAVAHVAQVTAHLAPYHPDANLSPMCVADYYPGGLGRLHGSLAHLQVLAGLTDSALARMEPLLATAIAEPSDQVYGLMVGMSAARAQGRMDLHKTWLARLLDFIDRAREPYRSFEGRLYALQTVSCNFEYSLRTWAMNDLHHPDDLLAVAESLKARILLDEMAGCSTAPLPPPAGIGSKDPADTPASPVDADRSSKAMERTVFQAHFQGLPYDVVNELKQISYWAVGAMGGLESDAPAEQTALYALRERNLEQIKGSDDAQADAHGGFRGSARPATTEDIRAALAADELLVEFFIPRDPGAPNRYCWILVVHRDGSRRQGFYLDPDSPVAQYVNKGRLIERGPLSDLAAATRATILQGDEDGARQMLRRWFDLLIAPIIAMGFEPEHFRRWILVPHGALHLIPLHALVDGNGRYLIERVPVTTAPSATVWLRMLREHALAGARLLAVGNPALSDAHAPLPNAQGEVESIGTHLRCAPAPMLLTGAGATETRVKQEMAYANLLHFATHAELDAGNPRDGHRLLLCGDAGHDGALHAAEVRLMDLTQVRLLVLNTCDGAFCRYGPGDEPLGLLSAFIRAGVGNVVGGLWALPDHAARQFILWFYEGLDEGGPALALQRAAVRAIASGLPIAHWAGLALIGPARSLGLMPTPSTSATLEDATLEYGIP